MKQRVMINSHSLQSSAMIFQQDPLVYTATDQIRQITLIKESLCRRTYCVSSVQHPSSLLSTCRLENLLYVHPLFLIILFVSFLL